MVVADGRAHNHPTRAPTTFAWAEYRLGADSVFKHRRETERRDRGEARFVAMRIRGTRLREAIVTGRICEL
jgi:hypothetical protein